MVYASDLLEKVGKEGGWRQGGVDRIGVNNNTYDDRI